MGRIVGVGNAHVDYTYTVSSLPEADAGGVIHDCTRRLGGTELNILRILNPLGHDTGLIARLGDDERATAVRDRLEELTIDTSRVQTGTDEETSYCLVLQTPDGQRSIFGGGESSFALSLDSADLDYLAGADAVVTSGFVPASVLESILTVDTTVVFDLAGTLAEIEPRGYTPAVLDEQLPAADLVVGSRPAFTSYLDTAPTPEKLRARGITRGAITAGAAGATVFDATTEQSFEAPDVEVVDTTGAGDAFTAGLLDQLVAGQTLTDAGAFAVDVAGLACTVSGAGVLPEQKVPEDNQQAELHRPPDR